MASPRGRQASAQPAGVTVGRRPPRSATRRELAKARSLAPVLELWFACNGREFPWRSWRDPYRLAVTEVLLQRTRAGVIAAFVPAFFAQFPDWHALAGAKSSELESILQVLGLQRRRAESLLSLANAMHGRLDTPNETAPGVGQYIGRALRVAIGSERLAMIDSNYVRVIRRVFGGHWMSDYRHDPRLQALAAALVEGGRDPRASNWAVLDLGGTICRPRRPVCPRCPLRERCVLAREANLNSGR